jgi:hypothetical protein
LPYNQVNQQFDGRPWFWLTAINYTGKIERAATPRLHECVYLKPAVACRDMLAT